MAFVDTGVGALGRVDAESPVVAALGVDGGEAVVCRVGEQPDGQYVGPLASDPSHLSIRREERKVC